MHELLTAVATPQPTPENDGIFLIIDVIIKFYQTGIDDHLPVFGLLVLIVADILLGVARAWAQNRFSSSKLRKGVVSHVTVFLAVMFSYPFAEYAGQAGFVNSFILAMVASYAASIVKNLSMLGVKLPYLENFIERNLDHDKELFQQDGDVRHKTPKKAAPKKKKEGGKKT